jgi:HlyD family secretion protein
VSVAAIATASIVGLLIAPGMGFESGLAETRPNTLTSQFPRVEIVRPSRGGVSRQTIQPGTIHAFESVDLYSKASGFLETQAVDIGSAVKDQQVLAQIRAPEILEDVEEAATVVDRAKAQVEQAESRVATARAERDTAAAAVLQSLADIDRAVARRTLTEKQYARVKGLGSREAVEQKFVDEQWHDLEAAKAGERSARATLETAKAQVATTEAKILQVGADVAEAQAAIRVAESRLSRMRVLAGYTRIVSPFDGVVTRRSYHPGAFIRSATEGASIPLLTVMRTDLMRVVVQVPDLDVPLLDVGDKATVVVDALKGEPMTGTVARLARSEDPTTRTMRAEIDLPNSSGRLVEGMYGRVTIELLPPSGNLTLPDACVVTHAGKPTVLVVKDGRTLRRSVKLGEDNGTLVEILSGIGEQDDVITRPGSSLNEGAQVVANVAKLNAPSRP